MDVNNVVIQYYMIKANKKSPALKSRGRAISVDNTIIKTVSNCYDCKSINSMYNFRTPKKRGCKIKTITQLNMLHAIILNTIYN